MKTAFSTENITAFIAVTLRPGSITFRVTKGKATRYGCTDKETGRWSKAAFDLLHQ